MLYEGEHRQALFITPEMLGLSIQLASLEGSVSIPHAIGEKRQLAPLGGGISHLMCNVFPVSNLINMEKLMNEGKLVFRQFALPVSTFDYLKDFQRAYEGRHGVRLNNNQVIAIILSEHKETINVEGGLQHGNKRFKQ